MLCFLIASLEKVSLRSITFINLSSFIIYAMILLNYEPCLYHQVTRNNVSHEKRKF